MRGFACPGRAFLFLAVSVLAFRPKPIRSVIPGDTWMLGFADRPCRLFRSYPPVTPGDRLRSRSTRSKRRASQWSPTVTREERDNVAALLPDSHAKGAQDGRLLEPLVGARLDGLPFLNPASYRMGIPDRAKPNKLAQLVAMCGGPREHPRLAYRSEAIRRLPLGSGTGYPSPGSEWDCFSRRGLMTATVLHTDLA